MGRRRRYSTDRTGCPSEAGELIADHVRGPLLAQMRSAEGIEQCLIKDEAENIRSYRIILSVTY
jgi:hypothetical protein